MGSINLFENQLNLHAPSIVAVVVIQCFRWLLSQEGLGRRQRGNVSLSGIFSPTNRRPAPRRNVPRRNLLLSVKKSEEVPKNLSEHIEVSDPPGPPFEPWLGSRKLGGVTLVLGFGPFSIRFGSFQKRQKCQKSGRLRRFPTSKVPKIRRACGAKPLP